MQQSKAYFHDDSQRLCERSLNMHMSQAGVVRLFIFLSARIIWNLIK